MRAAPQSESDGEDINFSMLEDTLLEDARMLEHNKKKINSMTWEGVMKLVELRRKSALFNNSQNHFSKDQPPKPKIFPEQTDDGMKTLHDLCFLRCVLAEPETWWKKVPTSRPHLFKSIPLSFMSAQNKIADKTIGSLHYRAKP